MIHQWKGFDLEITDFNYHHDPTHPQVKLYHLKHPDLKHVEIIKVSDIPIYDISLERL